MYGKSWMEEQVKHDSGKNDPTTFYDKGDGGKGMGLGLSVCYSVLTKHGGHITIESHQGKGASFVLYLPVYAYQAKKKEVEKTLPPGTARVMIMDDDYHIRKIERTYLERLGYEVTDVKDGQEAIEWDQPLMA